MRRLIRPRRSPARRDDGGFTVVEVTVAIALITIVMTSLAAYFVNSSKLTEGQGRKQAGVQVAQTAVEKARSLNGIGLTHNRDKTSSDALWAQGLNTSSTTKFPGVAPYLTNVTEAYDTTSGLAANAGYSAPLPTDGDTVTVDGIDYTQNWFLGYCVRQGSNACTGGTDPNAKYTFVQVVVAVTWSDPSCLRSLCSYITTTLVSETQDPVFDQAQGATKPKIVNPGDQSHEINQTVALAITMTGGTAPMAWTPPTTLPAGLSWGVGSSQCSSSPVCVYGKPTAVTASPVKITLKVTDAFDYVSTAVFYWTITPGPTIDVIDDLTTDTNTAAALTATATKGTTPYVWSATGVPNGVTLSSSTGKFSGTPTRAGTFSVVIKVTDKYGNTDTEPFTWTVALASTRSGSCTPTTSTMQTCTVTAVAYGDGPFTWKITRADTTMNLSVSSDTKTATFSGQVTRQPHPVYYYNYTLTQTVTGAVYYGSFSIYNN